MDGKPSLNNIKWVYLRPMRHNGEMNMPAIQANLVVRLQDALLHDAIIQHHIDQFGLARLIDIVRRRLTTSSFAYGQDKIAHFTMNASDEIFNAIHGFKFAVAGGRGYMFTVWTQAEDGTADSFAPLPEWPL